MSEKQQQEAQQQTPVLNEEILAKIPTLEKYCTELHLPESVQQVGCHNPKPIQLSRALYEKDVGLHTIFQTFQESELIQESSGQVIALFQEIINPESSDNPNNREGKDGSGKDTNRKLKTGLVILGVSTLVGVGTVIAAPLVILAAGFAPAGIAAGSFGAWLMSTYGGAVASGSLCAILQSAGAVGLSAGASAAIGLASGGTTLGVASLVAGLKRDSTKTAGLAEYCGILREKKLITFGEWIKICLMSKIRKPNVVILELFELLLQKNIGLKMLCEDLQHVEEIETNVLNQLLVDFRNSEQTNANPSKCPDNSAGDHDNDHESCHKRGGDGDELVHGKLRVLAAIASVWLAAITPAVLSAFGLVSEGKEWGSEMAYLFVRSVLCCFLDEKIKKQK